MSEFALSSLTLQKALGEKVDAKALENRICRLPLVPNCLTYSIFGFGGKTKTGNEVTKMPYMNGYQSRANRTGRVVGSQKYCGNNFGKKRSDPANNFTVLPRRSRSSTNPPTFMKSDISNEYVLIWPYM